MAEAADSGRFTPAQQSVAAALLVVMKRAMRGGREAASTARQTLVANNAQTHFLLALIPDSRDCPSIRTIEQSAPSMLLDSLSLLAKQCASAGCQPLEVFTRSLDCKVHLAARLGNRKEAEDRRGRMRELCAALNAVIDTDAWKLEAVKALSELGVSHPVLLLTVHFLAHFRLLQELDDEEAQEGIDKAAGSHTTFLEHLLPGEPVTPVTERCTKRPFIPVQASHAA